MPLPARDCVQINQAIYSLAHAYESRLAGKERQHPTGLALSDRAVLMALGQLAPINSRRLSEVMDINPGTVSVYVQRLVARGLVRRERDQDDRRNWWLNLTKAGDKAYRETITRTANHTRDFLSALDEAEQQTLHRLLRRVSHGLGFG